MEDVPELVQKTDEDGNPLDPVLPPPDGMGDPVDLSGAPSDGTPSTPGTGTPGTSVPGTDTPDTNAPGTTMPGTTPAISRWATSAPERIP